jgi:hypothetical protein
MATGSGKTTVMNDEAHHAYRIRREEADDDQLEMFGDEDEAEDFFKEATVWIDGLDRIQKLRRINFCVDLSATPYFLSRVGQETNRPFPWVVSDFGLIDAIESGLTKIPQLAVRDTTGAPIPGCPGSTADVDFWTSRDVYEVVHSHLNFVVPDTLRWEQSAAYYIDRHPNTRAFAKNAGLGFYIPYLHNGQRHDYTPDYLVQRKGDDGRYVILEVKGWDPLEEVKRMAAEWWVAAVNADGQYGHWRYAVDKRPEDVKQLLDWK